MAKAKNAASKTPAAGEVDAKEKAPVQPSAQEKGPTIAKPPVSGRYVMDHKEIPKEVLAFVGQKLGKDAPVNPAREGGGYKGKVLLNSGDYLVQAVGRDSSSAVVHRKADVAMVGSNLEWRNKNDRLQSVDVQIHYEGGQAKVYPWNREKEDQLRFMNKAKDYAKTISNDKERASFLKHIERFTGQSKGQEQSGTDRGQGRAAERPISQDKSRSTGPER